MSNDLLQSLFDDTESVPQTVSELTADIKRALERGFRSVWVEAEIADFSEAASGHWYFTLHDGDAQIKAACFRGTNWKIRFKPENGLQVRVRGKVSVYPPRGEYQVIVDSLKPVGEGALKVAFEQIKRKLQDEGLFDAERKRELPYLPGKVAVVTSPTGAAIHDIVNVLTRRTKTVDIVLIPSVVQGDAAPESIRRGVRLANAFNKVAPDEDRIDVLIVGRGGGSAEDLSAFNDEMLARSIADSKIPVISAVGHEIDVSISDYVADLRAPTPSAAAELVAGSEEELRSRLNAFESSVSDSIRLKLLNSERHLSELTQSGVLRDFPSRLIEAGDQVDMLLKDAAGAIVAVRREFVDRLSDLRRRLSPLRLSKELGEKKLRLGLLESANKTAIQKKLKSSEEILGLRGAELQAFSPLGVLERGYSITKDSNGKVIKEASAVKRGDEIEVALKKGVIQAKVTGSVNE